MYNSPNLWSVLSSFKGVYNSPSAQETNYVWIIHRAFGPGSGHPVNRCIIHRVLGWYSYPSNGCTRYNSPSGRDSNPVNLCIINQVFGPVSGLLSSKLVYNSPSLGLVLISFKYVYNSPSGRDSNYVNLKLVHNSPNL